MRDLDMHLHLQAMNSALVNNLQICDLGSARILDHTQLQTTAVGTYAWMAPEVGGMTSTAIHDWLSPSEVVGRWGRIQLFEVVRNLSLDYIPYWVMASHIFHRCSGESRYPRHATSTPLAYFYGRFLWERSHFLVFLQYFCRQKLLKER